MNRKVAATLTIHRIPEMTQRGRKNVVNWLRRLAREILVEPESYAKTFRARYYRGDEAGQK